MSIEVKPKAAGDHVGYVERAIRIIKERVVAIRASLRYKLDDILLRWLNVFVVTWLNLFPKRDQVFSPFSLHTKTRLDYRDLTRARFGDAVVAHRVATSETQNYTHGEPGVCVGVSVYAPGAIWFLSQETGKVKLRRQFELAPAIDLVAVYGVNKYAAPVATWRDTVGEYHGLLLPSQKPLPGGGRRMMS